MVEIDLTQTEADLLVAMEKRRVDDSRHQFPFAGGALSIPLVSMDKREQFVLDISRGSINLAKVKYQNRARQAIILVRLELAGSAHRNPDDTEIPCPHIHLYREGYSDKWAFPVPGERFANLEDAWRTLEDFMRYCSIVEPPHFERGLYV